MIHWSSFKLKHKLTKVCHKKEMEDLKPNEHTSLLSIDWESDRILLADDISSMYKYEVQQGSK